LQEPKRAEELLSSILAPDLPAQTLGQRLVWCAHAEVTLARGDAQQALAIVERLEAGAANRPPSGPAPILRLLLLRGQSLTLLDRPEEAEPVLRAALDLATKQGARPMLWRVQVALGHVFRHQERHNEAESTCAAARVVIEELAIGIQEEALRDAFVRQAIALLPPTRTRAARRITRHPVGPLTARECEVAAEIARGKSNAAIASTLVVSERTVESHIGNILSKLGFTSRKAIAAWATETGLVRERD
jgi:DNA-binding CsgD family transcriptional regulator